MQSWQICGVGILTALAIVVIKQLRAEMALPLRLVGGVLLMGAVLAMSAPIYAYVKDLIAESAVSQFDEILIKALGIALMTHVCAEICRDCGEGGVASCVELAGKCEILLLSLPLLSSILGVAAEILGWTA
ncbi:MAG: hypothetical protein IJY27_01855 [Clostridia bacterium]|nr:hypothetical protein [Clostridia bacterium]